MLVCLMLEVAGLGKRMMVEGGVLLLVVAVAEGCLSLVGGRKGVACLLACLFVWLMEPHIYTSLYANRTSLRTYLLLFFILTAALTLGRWNGMAWDGSAWQGMRKEEYIYIYYIVPELRIGNYPSGTGKGAGPL